MESSGNDAVAAGVSIVVVLFAVLISIGLYIFTCYCFKRICEKCKVIRRRGRIMIICENPRHKQRQG